MEAMPKMPVHEPEPIEPAKPEGLPGVANDNDYETAVEVPKPAIEAANDNYPSKELPPLVPFEVANDNAPLGVSDMEKLHDIQERLGLITSEKDLAAIDVPAESSELVAGHGEGVKAEGIPQTAIERGESGGGDGTEDDPNKKNVNISVVVNNNAGGKGGKEPPKLSVVEGKKEKGKVSKWLGHIWKFIWFWPGALLAAAFYGMSKATEKIGSTAAGGKISSSGGAKKPSGGGGGH